MTWEYVTGFFDGEGNVRLHGAGRVTPSLNVCQSGNRGITILTNIQEFLRLHGIDSRLYLGKKLSKNSKLIQHKLMTQSRESGLKWINGVLPFSVVKKVELQDLRRHLILFPPLKTRLK